MELLQIQLNERNSKRTDEVARRVGKAPADLVNEAVEVYLAEVESDATDWKSAIMQAAGIWKDRDDLPDFAEIRRSMDRDPWSR